MLFVFTIKYRAIDNQLDIYVFVINFAWVTQTFIFNQTNEYSYYPYTCCPFIIYLYVEMTEQIELHKVSIHFQLVGTVSL